MTDKPFEYLYGIVEKNWDEIGACRSCGWHASLREHWFEADDVNDNGDVELSCLRDSDHKGISFNVHDLEGEK